MLVADNAKKRGRPAGLPRPKMFRSISFHGGTNYILALRVVAAKRQVQLGVLVRQAVEQVYGSEVKAVLQEWNKDPEKNE